MEDYVERTTVEFIGGSCDGRVRNDLPVSYIEQRKNDQGILCLPQCLCTGGKLYLYCSNGPLEDWERPIRVYLEPQ